MQDKEANQTGQMTHVRLLKPGPKGNLKDHLAWMASQQRNSFTHIKNWVKGEIYSLEALT